MPNHISDPLTLSVSKTNRNTHKKRKECITHALPLRRFTTCVGFQTGKCNNVMQKCPKRNVLYSLFLLLLFIMKLMEL